MHLVQKGPRKGTHKRKNKTGRREKQRFSMHRKTNANILQGANKEPPDSRDSDVLGGCDNNLKLNLESASLANCGGTEDICAWGPLQK
jgi:hypothetical protein